MSFLLTIINYACMDNGYHNNCIPFLWTYQSHMRSMQYAWRTFPQLDLNPNFILVNKKKKQFLTLHYKPRGGLLQNMAFNFSFLQEHRAAGNQPLQLHLVDTLQCYPPDRRAWGQLHWFFYVLASFFLTVYRNHSHLPICNCTPFLVAIFVTCISLSS